MKKIVIANNKGGVGKTTVASQIAHSLAAAGNSVVCVDLDSQRNMSSSLEDMLELGNARTIVEGRCCMDRGSAATDAACFILDAINAAQVQRR